MFTRINHFIIFILTFTCFVINSRSQIDSSHNSYAAYSLIKGSWSAQFDIGTYINSGKFESFVISVKRHFSSHTALRLGFSYNNSNDDGSINLISNGFQFSHPNLIKSETGSAELNFLYYFKPGSVVNIFAGAGPIYKYNFNRYNNYSADNSPSYGTSEIINDGASKSWSAGLNGIFGAEWFPFQAISLVAEYNAHIMFGKTTTTSTHEFRESGGLRDYNSQSSESNSIDIYINIVRLGISAYF